jgi:hypothetical protein
MRRVTPLALASLLLLLACEDQIGPPHDIDPGGRSAALWDADHGEHSNPYARWLEPMVQKVNEEDFGTFDPTVESLQLHVVLCTIGPLEGTGCDTPNWQNPDAADPVDRYSVTAGTIRIQDNHYHAQIELSNLSISDGEEGPLYRLVATVIPFSDPLFPTIVVAYADFRVLPNAKVKSTLNDEEIALVGDQLPARIRLDEGVLTAAVQQDYPAIQEAIKAFGNGTFTLTVVLSGVPAVATYPAVDPTAAFVFPENALIEDEDIAFLLGTLDECGDAFEFPKYGCHRALAVPFDPDYTAKSTVTSGYTFANDVNFCIDTGLGSHDLPVNLVKIDDDGQGSVYQVLEQTNPEDACNLIGAPNAVSFNVLHHPVAWLRHTVGRRLLDFVASPLLAEHSVTKMGSSIGDLSDLTAALLTELTVAEEPPSQMLVGSTVPVTFQATYMGVGEEGDDPYHAPEPAAFVPVEFEVLGGGSLADETGAAVTGPLVTDVDGKVAVLWTVELGTNTLTAISSSHSVTVTIEGIAAGVGDGALYGVNSKDQGLTRIDPASGQTEFVGRLGGDDLNAFTAPVALSRRPGDNGLVAFTQTGGSTEAEAGGDGAIVEVNACTGVGTAIQSDLAMPGKVTGLAIDGQGTLYVGFEEKTYLSRYNGNEWVEEFLSLTVGADSYYTAGMAFHPDGTLYVLGGTDGNNAPAHLLAVDPDGLTVTYIHVLTRGAGGQPDWQNVGDLAISSNGVAAVNIAGGHLYALNLKTGHLSRWLDTGDYFAEGLAFGPVPVCP